MDSARCLASLRSSPWAASSLTVSEPSAFMASIRAARIPRSAPSRTLSLARMASFIWLLTSSMIGIPSSVGRSA